MPVRGECDERQVYCVQHQLDRHEDGDDVALDEKPSDSAGEQNRAQHQIIRKRNHHGPFLGSAISTSSLSGSISNCSSSDGGLRGLGGCAKTMAPMIAIRISTEVTSKGSRNS